jgi:hypothetical protein
MAKGRDAEAWCASPFIQLEIQEPYFNLQFPKSVITQGESGFVTIGVEAARPSEGQVEMELVGLPAGASTEQPRLAWTEGTPQLNYPVLLAADARVGQHQTLAIKATITRAGGRIEQVQGTGELQIVPPPPKPAADMAAAPAPAPAPAAPPTKVLTRLEQLRQSQSPGAGS